MKTLTLFATLLFSTLFSFAQTDSYTLAMQKELSILDTMKTESTTKAVAKDFETIAGNSLNWEPQYFAAYSNLLTGIRGKQDQETKDQIYNKALKYINKADSISPNNSEIYALKGYIKFMLMSVYPQQRAMNMIPEANELFDKAIALDATNPRAYLLKGQNLFYVPEMFGGSKDEAKTVLTIAKEKFEKFKAKNLQPNWGKARVEELLKQY